MQTSADAMHAQDAETTPAAAPSDAAPFQRAPTISGGSKAMIVIFTVAICAPNFFFVGPVRLAPYLAVLILMFVPLLGFWLSGTIGRSRLPDAMVIIASLWASVALFKAHGIEDSIETAGVFILQSTGAYLLGRFCVRDLEHMAFLFRILAIAAVLLAPFALIETLTGLQPYLRLFSIIGPVYADANMPPRLGFERVQVSFEHPILFGVFIASLAGLIVARIKNTAHRVFALGAVVIGTFFSLSTGAYLTLIVQGGLFVWAAIFSNNPKRWRNLFLLTAFMYISVDLASNRTPFNVFVDYLTLNSGSAYNRILIWKFGSAEVWRFPFFGIGLNEWERPHYMSPSMDNFWLVLAVRYGLPTFGLLFGAIFLVLWRAGRRIMPTQEHILHRRGMIISIVAVLVAICSVHLWNATYAWLMFVVGCTAWMMEVGDPPGAAATTEAAAKGDPEQAALARAARAKRRAVLGDVQAVREMRENEAMRKPPTLSPQAGQRSALGRPGSAKPGNPNSRRRLKATRRA